VVVVTAAILIGVSFAAYLLSRRISPRWHLLGRTFGELRRVSFGELRTPWVCDVLDLVAIGCGLAGVVLEVRNALGY
jgi:hypothetical protein